MRGRTGLFELLEIDDTLRRLIAERAPLEGLRRHAAASGFRTLAEDGDRKVAAGWTSPAEVRRILGEAS